MNERHDNRFPGESDAYREARNELLAAEEELRSQVERVARLRRELPMGGKVPKDYVFVEGGADLRDRETRDRVRMSELFAGGKQTLVAYSFMYGPQMDNPCPLCTSLLDGLNGNAEDIEQNVNLVVIARSPIERIREFARRRGWNNLRMLSSHDNAYNDDYFGEAEDGSMQWPMLNVFVRDGGATRHFWGSELFFVPGEGDQDTRHVDMFWPVWNVLDVTPEGRGDWYPSLDYK